MMARFRIGISADLFGPDGQPAWPMFDLGRLAENTAVDLVTVAAYDGWIAPEAVAGFDALILGSPNFTAASVPGDGRLALIARFGANCDTIDVAACRRSAIAVTVATQALVHPRAVAGLTLVLALAGKLPAKSVADNPADPAQQIGIGLEGRTLGSIGFGPVAAELFRLCQPLGLRFIAGDPVGDPARADELGVRLVGLDQVFRKSDILTVNCPVTPEPRQLVDGPRLAIMKPGAVLISTSDGAVVDRAALVAALNNGHLAGAGLDRFDPAATANDRPVADNAIVTVPSLAWTDQCIAAIGGASVAAALAVMQGRPPDDMVDPRVAQDDRFLAKLARNRDRFV